MMAQSGPHPATDRRRVKVYELRNDDWFDRGTGFCTAAFTTNDQGRKDPRVIVESEDQPECRLLETKIHKEDGFQKQQETLIVWQEPGSGVDMALSFQEAEGCQLIWKFVSNVQHALQNSTTVIDGLPDDLAMELHLSVNLPAAELGNLVEIDTSMRIMTSTASGRDTLAKSIMAEDYIGKLISLVEIAEDLESLSDLHRLCNIIKTILLLNDTTIIEHAVSDECVQGVVGALEYDPDFPSHKANHRHWLGNQGRFKEVVPIEDEQTRRKIHQTYRLQYLKDVVLARILDDPTFSVLNSLIFFNQVEIVQQLQSDSAFLSQLFGLFHARCHDERRRKEAVLFIQQCCAIAKNIQPPARQSLYHTFVAHGLLHVIHFGLRHRDVAVRVGATDIMVSIIEHDPHMIRQTIYRQMHDNQPVLTDSLIDLLLVEVDLGVNSQISEALKVLLDQVIPNQVPDPLPRTNGELLPRARSQAGPDPQNELFPQQELFLTQFYERSASVLFKPLLDLENRKDLEFSVQEAAMFTYLVEILCFFGRQHHRFSRFFILSNNLVERVCQLLRCQEKYLRLVSIRFIRYLVGCQEEFFTNHLIEKQAFGPILDLLAKTLPRDNLLSSASLEIFEHIRKEDCKELMHHLVANHRGKLHALSYLPTFQDIILQIEQPQRFAAPVDFFAEGEDELGRRVPAHVRLMEQISVDPTEEEYWNTSDPDEEDEEPPDAAAAEKPSLSAKPNALSSSPLVDYPSDDDSDESANPSFDARPKADEPFAPADAAADHATPTTPTVPMPPERVAEKRRREEDEDELGKIMQNKRRSGSFADINANAGSFPRRRTFSAGSVSNPAHKRISINICTAVKTGPDGGGARSEEDV